MPELDVNTRTVFTMPSFLQTSCWNRVILSSDWVHRSGNSMVVTMNLLTNMVWPSQTWDITCFLCHSFPSSFNTDMTLYEWLGGCFMKSRGRLPYRFTWSMLTVYGGVRVAHLFLVLCMLFFCCLHLCYMLWVSGFQILSRPSTFDFV